MKSAAFIVLCLALVAYAKPRVSPKITVANGKIIGGHDAEPRKFILWSLAHSGVLWISGALFLRCPF